MSTRTGGIKLGHDVNNAAVLLEYDVCIKSPHAARPAAGISAGKRVPASIPEPVELATQVLVFNQLNHISISETERLRSSGRPCFDSG